MEGNGVELVNIRAAVFDFDGVIIDSVKVQEYAFYESYKQVVGEGNPCFKEFLSHAGDAIDRIFEKMGLPLEMVGPYRSISRENVSKIIVFDGVENLLTQLKEQGVKIGLCTGKDRVRTIEILRTLGLEKYFSAIVCSDDVPHPKPHPGSLLRCLQLLGSQPEESVMIGDAVYDLQCAKAAGVRGIAALWGETLQEQLYAEGADEYCQSVRDLQAVFTQREKIYPLAITDIDEQMICVSGVNEKGEWIRPEPLYQSDLTGEDGPLFSYRCQSDLFVVPSTAEEQRVEDRDLLRRYEINISDPLTDKEWLALLCTNCTPSVQAVFECGRSIGLIQAEVIDIQYGRNLGGGKKIRMIFRDQTNEEYNFIVADRQLKERILQQLNEQGEWDCIAREQLLRQLTKGKLYLTVGLTRRVTGFPGPYNGCHPLVTGVHLIPHFVNKREDVQVHVPVIQHT